MSSHKRNVSGVILSDEHTWRGWGIERCAPSRILRLSLQRVALLRLTNACAINLQIALQLTRYLSRDGG
jgi:hypothetical protein